MSKRFGISRRKVLAASLTATPLTTRFADNPSIALGQVGKLREDPTLWHIGWQSLEDGAWVGNEFWGQPLQDWRVREGHLECANPAPNRQLHYLTRSIRSSAGAFNLGTFLTRADGKKF